MQMYACSERDHTNSPRTRRGCKGSARVPREGEGLISREEEGKERKDATSNEGLL